MNLSKIIISICICIYAFNVSAQSWQQSGNIINSSRWLGSINNESLLFKTAGQPRMVITKLSATNTWGVGIGTTSPLHKLHVDNGAIMVSGTNPGGGAMLLFSDNINTAAYPNGRWGIEYEPNQHGLNFWEPWNPTTGGGANWLLFLKDDGKIGMSVDPTPCPGTGLTSFPQGYRLFVKDGIITEKLKIANFCSSQWADYVFDSDYKLLSLPEVEKFIRENKHLPEIPSAIEIEKEGLDLAEMVSKQMLKIEELTLYIIELNKRINELESETTN